MRQLRIFDKLFDTYRLVIENRISGEFFEVVVLPIAKNDLPYLKKTLWAFDWKKEHKKSDRLVYKLTTVENPTVIQGLISLRDSGDHAFVFLAESASFNRGNSRLYSLVGVHLFAFACQFAFDNGHDGFVCFDSKTKLIDHYRQSLGAQRMGNSLRMFIDTQAARRLVTLYNR